MSKDDLQSWQALVQCVAATLAGVEIELMDRLSGKGRASPVFGWFRPTCPVDPAAKEWVEERLAWLADQFGLDVFTRRALVLPTDEFFPDEYNGTDESVRALLDRVCTYMDADPERVDLELFTDRADFWLVNDRGQYIPREAGMYDEGSHKTVIHLETSQLAEPMTLVGTMAHELAHLRLLGEQRISADVFDNELLTDLTAVFYGFGIFLANVPTAWESDFTIWPGTDVRKPKRSSKNNSHFSPAATYHGYERICVKTRSCFWTTAKYMTQPMFGYALAHMAWFRNERKPEWSRYLRMDARACFKQGLRYLWEARNSHFRPRNAA